MGQMTIDQHVDDMTTPSRGRLHAFGAALAGTGGETQQLHKQLTQITTALPGLGAQAASEVERWRGATEIPHEHRTRLINGDGTQPGIISTANNNIGKAFADGTAIVKQLEEKLVDTTLPHIHHDAAHRLLVRDELRNVFEGQADKAKVARDRLGINTSHDAELLGEYGRTLLGKDYETYRITAAGHYFRATSGTELQAAGRRALQAFHDGKIAAVPRAFEQAARMHLRRVTG